MSDQVDVIEVAKGLLKILPFAVAFYYLEGYWLLIPVLVLVFIIVKSPTVFRTLPKKYSERPFQARAWKREFPDASNDDIRQFLTILTDAYAFKQEERLRFHPNETSNEIFNSIESPPYPHLFWEDEGSLEFYVDFEFEYNIDLESMGIDFHETSLGELFRISQNKRSE